MKSTSHASYQTHNNLRFRKKGIASDAERNQINRALNKLVKAKTASTEKQFVELVTEAFTNCRQIVRGRIV